MAKTNFPIYPPPTPLPTYETTSLGTFNADAMLLEMSLNDIQTDLSTNLRLEREQYRDALRNKIVVATTHGRIPANVLAEKRVASARYHGSLDELYQKPEFKKYGDPFSRKAFNIKPYEMTSRKLNHPYPGFSAAQDGLWPGYEKPEYKEQYPFLENYGGILPFLAKHRIEYNFPETFARYGGVFVPPPYATLQQNKDLRSHMERCHPYFHTAPVVSKYTSKEELDLILSYYEDDFMAVVEDEGHRVIGVVGRKEASGRGSRVAVEQFMKTDFHETPSPDIEPKDAFLYMEDKGVDYLLLLDDGKPKIMTKTSACFSHFLPPFKYKSGLGSMAYIGVSDQAEAEHTLDELMRHGDGIPGADIETAHGALTSVLLFSRRMRERYQDLFMMGGTVIHPEYCDMFIQEIAKKSDDKQKALDAMKIGIARGRACRTSTAAVGLEDLYPALQCGGAIHEDGTMVLDGWGTPDEFIIGLSVHGVRARQGGGSLLARRESANPWIRDKNGKWGKFYRGMAGPEAQKAKMEGKPLSVEKRMELHAFLHSEGAEEFVHSRFPNTLGRVMLMYKFLLQSAMSYSGVRSDHPESHLKQFQENAELFIVPAKERRVEYEELSWLQAA